MQGFPVGGSRIRLSWGRSQCKINCSAIATCGNADVLLDKAAQAAAQAAQSAALQGQPSQSPAPNMFQNITPQQAYDILQKIAAEHGPDGRGMDLGTAQLDAISNVQSLYEDERMPPFPISRDYSPPGSGSHQQQRVPPVSTNGTNGSSFSPFSDSSSYGQNSARQGFGRPWKYEGVSPVGSDPAKISTRPPSSTARYGPFLNGSPPKSSTGRPPRMEAPISRPTSSNPKVNETDGQEWDAMHDLNGTLASLDLDRDRPWKSPTQGSD
jgi:hypothetical protein